MFPGRPATFDAVVHISVIAQFSEIIKAGEFPVIWMNNFANYGIPVGRFTHQTTNYLGGLITLFIHDPVLVFNLLTFAEVFLTNILLYLFLRLYFSPLASFLGIFIFCFTPYRILNVYTRGALPDVFAGIFLPLILVVLYLLIVKKKLYAFFLLTLFIVGLTLTHPMMLVVFSSLFVPYLIYLLIVSNLSIKSRIKIFVASTFFMLLGLLICSYYAVPLNLEIKYFYFGLEDSHQMANSYLAFMNFFSTKWYYFTNTEVFTRGHIILFGLIETVTLILGFVYFLYKKIVKKNKENMQILTFCLIVAALMIYFTTQYADIFFQKLFFLNNIQFPWRFLSVLIFIPAIVAAFLYDRFPKRIIFVVVIMVVAYFSFPQIYGKNYTMYPIQSYFITKENVHSVEMNTIWTGKSEDYPDKDKQGEIIEGTGKIVNQTLRNSSRNYQVAATTPLRMVDRTFYFPGWNVYIDNVKTNIEFQDPNYRGVITYRVPAGFHAVKVVFENTKVRSIANGMSILFLFITIALFVRRKCIGKYIFG